MGNSNGRDKENRLIETFADHEDAINTIAISEDQSLIATGSEDKTIRMWSTKTSNTECLGVLRGHSSYITCLSICDTYVISGAADNTIRKWDMTTCECLVKYVGHTSRISRVICNGNVIFSTSYDKTARVWDFDPEMDDDEIEQIAFRTYTGHTRGVYPLIFMQSLEANADDENPLKFHMSDVLVTGSADNTARSWSAETGAALRIFRGHRGPITCMATDPQGIVLYTGSSDGTIRSWNIKSGETMKEMEGHEGPVTALLIVNRLMYSGSQDGQARCWVREFGDCTRVYRGHKHSIVAMKFKDGILYTGSGDTTIRAFEAKSGVVQTMFEGHEGAVTSVVIVGDRLYSGSFDTTLRVWNVKGIKDSLYGEATGSVSPKIEKKQENHLNVANKRLSVYMNDFDKKTSPDYNRRP